MKYVIQKGDSLSRIAKRLGMTVKDLAEMNGIPEAKLNYIRAGDSLNVTDRKKESIKQQVAQVTQKAPTRARSPFSTMIGGELKSRFTDLPEEPKKKAPVNPRQRAMQQRREAAATPSRGLMARSQQRQTTQEDSDGGVFSLLTSTPANAFAAAIGNSPVLGSEFFKDAENEILRRIAADKIKSGSTGIVYSDYNKEAGSKIGYQMGLPDVSDPTEALKFTLGRTDLVRDGDKIVAADEFDFEGEEKIAEKSIIDQVKFLADRAGQYLSGDLSTYGAIHSVGEVFAPPGQGPSFRIDLGTAEDLGISKQQFNRLPTLDDYSSRYKGRIKQRPIRDLFKKRGIL